MHSCETLPPPPATGPNLLQELGRLIIRARSRSPSRQPGAPPGDARDRLLKAKLLAAKSLLPQPSTSQQVVQQPRPRVEPGSSVEVQLNTHVHALWHEQIPICIEVLLAPDCPECFAQLDKSAGEPFDKQTPHSRGLLLERWTMSVMMKKNHEQPSSLITSQWLLSAVRSQLHFSQLGAWLARLSPKTESRRRPDDPTERRRKLSRETCNIKKLESNCDTTELQATGEPPARKLNVVYSIKIPGESYHTTEFTRTPTDHTFPITDIGNNVHLKVVLESLPRIPEIPTIKCLCGHPKRRVSKEMASNLHEDLTTRINDLNIGTGDGHRSHFNNDLGIINSNIGSSGGVTRRLSIFNNQQSTEYILHKEHNEQSDEMVDDRMHTLCSESGKHKCHCDDESDQGKDNQSSSKQETKMLDEKRVKEIAKYKRRMRKESKLRKLRDSTSESTGTSEGDGVNAKSKETRTSIPILQASRFDRFRAIGCYRNQTYLTLPSSRIETKSPFITESIPPIEFKKTNTVSTQTDDFTCDCGSKIFMKCEDCKRGMKRSDGNYNLNALNDKDSNKKLKCDNIVNNNSNNNINNKTCDISSVAIKDGVASGIRKTPDDDVQTNIIKRPKLKKFLPVVERIEKIVSDRFRISKDTENDIEDLLLKDDDSVFAYPSNFRQEPSKNNQGQDVPMNKQRTDLTQDVSKTNIIQRPERQRKTNSSISEDYVLYEKCYYGTFDKCDVESPSDTTSPFIYPDNNKSLENPDTKSGFQFPDLDMKFRQNGSQSPSYDSEVPDPDSGFQFPDGPKDSIPSPTEMDRFRWRFDSAASMVFHTKTGLPLTSSPAPLKRGNNCFDYDDSINDISGIKSALFHPISPGAECTSPASPAPLPRAQPPAPRPARAHRPNVGPSAGLLGSFEESALKGRLEPVATVHGFTAELGASGAFCPPHRKLPVTVFFYAPGGTNAPYMGHINLGTSGYRVARSGTIQVSLFNPHGTLVKMFVVLYDLTAMPAAARTFLRQRTLYLPAGSAEPPARHTHKFMRYLIHLRFMTSKSGKLYLHTDIRIIVSRKADMDTATAHTAIFNSVSTNNNQAPSTPTNHSSEKERGDEQLTNHGAGKELSGDESTNRKPCRVFGGCSDFKDFEFGYENQNGVSYELRSFTYGPENPKYSPR